MTTSRSDRDDRAVGISITIPLNMLHEMDELCARARLNRSELVRRAIKAIQIDPSSVLRESAGLPDVRDA